MQLAHSVRRKLLYIRNYLSKACNSQKNTFVCSNHYFLCVTRIDIASTMQDLAGTGLTEPLQPQEGQPQDAALEDAGENLL